MVIGISSNGGMKTTDERWLVKKNQWKWIMMVVRKPLHPCGPVSSTTTSSFAIYTVVVSWCGYKRTSCTSEASFCLGTISTRVFSYRMTIVTTTAAAACTTHHTIVCVRPRRNCSSWLRGGVGGCSYHPSPPKNYE
jgi:hypothetical protein